MNLHMPKSYYFVGYVFSTILTMGLRFSYRLIRSYLNGKIPGNDSTALDRVMIIGAGQAGQAPIKEMQTKSRLHVTVCCVIDHNPNENHLHDQQNNYQIQ